MSLFTAFAKTLKQRGIAQTLKKMLNFLWRQITLQLTTLPLYFDLVKLHVLATVVPRGRTTIVRIAGMRVTTTDVRALLGEFREIFIHQIYGFNNDGARKDLVIIDGGGYIGISALYFKRRYPTAKVTVFEPNAEIVPILSDNLRKNNAVDVTIVQAALGRENGRQQFGGGNDSGKIDGLGSTVIEVKKLSEFITQPTDFVKLNIEGAECEVISELEVSGALANINKFCIEWHSFARQAQDLGTLLAIFERNGFRYFVNDFNRRINPALKTPFNVSDNNEYFLLVYAQKNNITA
jgi:FkbM family methyltransferase